MGTNVMATNYTNYSEIYAVQSTTRSSSFTYDNFDIQNGMTMLLGNGNNTNNGCFYVKSGTIVTFTTKLSSNQSNIDMGYYNNSTGKYVECNWTVSGNYTYICTMTISSSGYYKFFISNNTANTLTFKSTTVTY